MSSINTVYYVETRIAPYNEWKREYFCTDALAIKVFRFYREHCGQIQGGMDLNVGRLSARILYTPAGPRLEKTGEDGALYPVQDRFDLVERAQKIQMLAEFVSETVQPIEWNLSNRLP